MTRESQSLEPVWFLSTLIKDDQMRERMILWACGMALMSNVNASQNFIPGEFIVKLSGQKGALLSKQAKINSQESITSDVVLVRSNSDLSQKKFWGPAVQYIEPNYLYHINGFENAEAPDDALFKNLWGMSNDGSIAGSKAGVDINALSAWEITRGDKRIKVAVIDTGIDYTHPDLKENIYTNEAELNGTKGVDDDQNGYIDDIHGYDFANKDGDPIDDHSHGTHCAGTIGAIHNNQIGVAGVMSEVTLVPLKFLTAQGSGSLAGAIGAIDYATKLGVNVMSNSWGGGGYSKALEDAIKAAHKKGIVFVAAAGNDKGSNNDTKPVYPAGYKVDNVIAVAAISSNGKVASFSNIGPKTVHVAAPGHNILSTVIRETYKSYSGTSMATPHVSGVVGLLFAAEADLTVEEVKERLVKTSVRSSDLQSISASGGRVDAHRALTKQMND